MFFTLELHFDEVLDMDDMPLLTLSSTHSPFCHIHVPRHQF